MLVVNGYFDGNVCHVEEKISQKPQKVKITFLEDNHNLDSGKIATKEEKQRVLDELNVLWMKHDNSVSVDEYVRKMRKGRQFDI